MQRVGSGEMPGRAPDASPPGRSATPRRSQRARRAILAAATALVGERGYGGTTIEAIAERAGVGKQTIYRWWSSKGAVVLDAFMDFNEHSPTPTPDPRPLDTGDFRGDLRRLVAGMVNEFATPEFEAPHRAMTIAVQEDPALAALTMERVVRPRLDQIRDWIVAAQLRGAVPATVEPDIAVELIVGPIFHRWLLRTAPLDDGYAMALAGELEAALTEPVRGRERS